MIITFIHYSYFISYVLIIIIVIIIINLHFSFILHVHILTPCMSFMRKVDIESSCWDIPFILDIDPPRLMNCPHTVVAYADRNSTHGVINWQEPYATDNHDSVVNVTKEGSISPEDEIAAGSYKVKYKATDSAGNNAKTCTTNIIMKGNVKVVLLFI